MVDQVFWDRPARGQYQQAGQPGVQKVIPEYLQSPLVTVVIPCFNHGRYLAEAVQSALDQTFPSIEVVVVDDGSSDNSAEVARSFPMVRYVWRARGGLAAARNTGLRASRGAYLVFLDADDRLLPNAVELNLASFAEHPDCGFVYGAHRLIWANGVPDKAVLPPLPEEVYEALLRNNFIAMHATVMYPRHVLEGVGGFDESLPACEDYALYLRIAKKYKVQGHQQLIADYRKHDENMSRNASLMLASSSRVLRSQRPLVTGDRRYEAAFREGVRFWQCLYGTPLLMQAVATMREPGRRWRGMRDMLTVFTRAPSALPAATARVPRYLARRLARRLPAPLRRTLRHLWDGLPPVGRVNFGDLRRVTPIDADRGFGRGLPVDRYYIEAFLAAHADDIRGRVLEVGDRSYTVRFGGGRVTTSDVLDVRRNPIATVVADLNSTEDIPSAIFDCVILTQTLQYIYDIRAAARTLHRVLKPGGVLLATVPGITQTDPGERHGPWCWSFTAHSVTRLFGDAFPGADIRVEAQGNVLAAVGFLHGLAVDELTRRELDYGDPGYPVIVSIRAQKAATA